MFSFKAWKLETFVFHLFRFFFPRRNKQASRRGCRVIYKPAPLFSPSFSAASPSLSASTGNYAKDILQVVKASARIISIIKTQRWLQESSNVRNNQPREDFIKIIPLFLHHNLSSAKKGEKKSKMIRKWLNSCSSSAQIHKYWSFRTVWWFQLLRRRECWHREENGAGVGRLHPAVPQISVHQGATHTGQGI